MTTSSPGPAGAGSPHARHWTLDPGVAYLNHGSFGACPRPILDLQAGMRAEMEREPMDYFIRRLPQRLAEAREAVAAFVGGDAEGLVFVTNATAAVNTALRAWELGPGDEVLVTDHTYGACRKAAAFVAARRGASLAVARVPFPLRDEGEVVEAILAAVTPRTRVAVIDHITSPTALVWPIARIVASLRARGVETIVDGAHALGQVPIDLPRIGAACYTANAHKWLCAPKGAAVLHVREDLRLRIRPLVVSHGLDHASVGVRFREEWDWTGTDDPTAWLSMPECIRFLGSLLPGGWPALMEANRRLALRAREIVASALGSEIPCPESMVGMMASIPMPPAAPGSPAEGLDENHLAAWMRERGVEPWFFPWPGRAGMLTRVSAQLYNDESQYRRLASLLAEALRAG